MDHASLMVFAGLIVAVALLAIGYLLYDEDPAHNRPPPRARFRRFIHRSESH